MAKKELEKRDNWQTESGPAGLSGIAENDFYAVFSAALHDTDYEFTKKPKDFKHLYDKIDLPPEISAQIYNPDKSTIKRSLSLGWGLIPDFSIKNKITGKTLFGEIKRQDGWVEGKKSSAGRGNVHERLCKLFTPGLLSEFRNASGITDHNSLPFWVILEGDITRDPKRNREIYLWFRGFENHYTMWRPGQSGQILLDHFNDNLKQLLD